MPTTHTSYLVTSLQVLVVVILQHADGFSSFYRVFLKRTTTLLFNINFYTGFQNTLLIHYFTDIFNGISNLQNTIHDLTDPSGHAV
jgi:hypothetical protein